MSKQPDFYRCHQDANGAVKQVAMNFDYFNEHSSVAKGSFGGELGRKFEDYDRNISVKSTYDRSDYEWFRGNTSGMDVIKQMKVAQKAYEKVGMVRNIIDMMGDFTMQGIRIEHPNPKKERFLQDWFEYVRGPEVSERFVNLLYRLGNVPIQAAFGIINKSLEERMSLTKGIVNTTECDEVKPTKREIPLKYTFVPPWEIEVAGGALGMFIDKPIYQIKVPQDVKAEIAKLQMSNNKDLQKAASDILSKLSIYTDSSNNQKIYLSDKNFKIYFYKKDDWQVWAIPMIAAIIDDLIMLERFKLADMSALDGAISNIRLWKVGVIDPSNMNNSIIPTQAGIDKIKTILANGVGGGTMDIVTGPHVDFKESTTQVHQFLGSEKYENTLNGIYDGLGIPPPLRSGSSGSNATNNYVSLKTLIEKLEYGRTILLSFWNKQLEIVQKALGHKLPGKVMFDNITLSDESAEKKLIIDLVDRDLISAEAVKYHFGLDATIENSKIKQERRARKNKNMPPKAGPFHVAEKAYELKKTSLTAGDVTPSQVGMSLKERKEGEKPRIEILHEQQKEIESKKQETKIKQMAGRPKNITETRKRKKKPNFRPQTGKGYNDLFLWSTRAYEFVSEQLSDVILNTFKKKNFRQLTNEETKEAEHFKFSVFAQLQPMSELTLPSLAAAIETNAQINDNIQSTYNDFLKKYIEMNGKEPNINEERQMRILSYTGAKFQEFSENGV